MEDLLGKIRLADFMNLAMPTLTCTFRSRSCCPTRARAGKSGLQKSLTVEFEPEQAICALPRLLPAAEDMNDEIRDMFHRLRVLLALGDIPALPTPQTPCHARAAS
jgi:hypothetical protein